MKQSGETFNIQHSTLNFEESGCVAAFPVECWALNVECSKFPKIPTP